MTSSPSLVDRARQSCLALSVVLALGGGAARAQAPGACVGEPTGVKLNVIIEGIRDDRGLMTATLYGSDPGKFLQRDGELRVWREPAHAPSQELCVYLPGPGTYSVAIYHDANSNHHFDRGFLGPLEGYGFTRNPHLILGPPPLERTTFAAGEGETTVRIDMRYP